MPRITESFRTGAGMGWHEHDDRVFHGCEKFFRPGYIANLVSAWIPALDGVTEKLEAGGLVADVGCGQGASTILMAQAYPHSRFVGFDYHAASIEAARESAQRAGVADRVRFDVAKAKDFPGHGYDFVAVFDCLHDMGDPIGAATHVRKSLAKDGTWMIVEPFAKDLSGQSQSGRTRVLLVLDAAVHAVLALSGSGTVPGCAGRGKTPARSGDRRRLQPVPLRDADTTQPGVRSAPVNGA